MEGRRLTLLETRVHGIWVPAFAGTTCCEIEHKSLYVLKKLFAASFDARFLVAACCSRSISEFISAMRSVSSSTDNSERSCPISWVTFFLGLSSSSAAMRLLRARRSPCGGCQPLCGWLMQGPLSKFLSLSQGQIMEKLPAQMTVIGISKPGGPEVLLPETRSVPVRGPGELLVEC